MANSVDLDETAQYEQSHRFLHCLRKLFWSAGLRGLDRMLAGKGGNSSLQITVMLLPNWCSIVSKTVYVRMEHDTKLNNQYSKGCSYIVSPDSIRHGTKTALASNQLSFNMLHT